MSDGSGQGADRHPDRHSRLLRGALHSLLLGAVALFFLNFNLVGTASPSRRFSQDLVYAWFGDQAWLYPREDTGRTLRTPTQPRVVVVMLDEHALALRGARWPVSVQFHAQFLGELEVLRRRGAPTAAGQGPPSAAVRMSCDTTPSPAACLARLIGAPAAGAGFELAWS